MHLLVNPRFWTLNTFFGSEAWGEGNGMQRPRSRGLIPVPEGLRLRRGTFLLYTDTGKVYGIRYLEQSGLNAGDVGCCRNFHS